MEMNRRKFITLAGAAAAIGLGSTKGLELVAAGTAHDNHDGDGVRWAMVINIRQFKKHPELKDKCVRACHLIHNVPKIDNPKHEIKWIWKEPFEHAFIEQENHHLPEDILHDHVLLLCNHCDNPPCTSVCPTQATWKREDGIVMMDWHRCVGCRYCMAACPYGSRSFNWFDPRKDLKQINTQFPTRTKGVVEKCTFCDERLARGKNPACADAVAGKNALWFGDLNDPKSDVREILANHFSIRRKPELGTQPEVYYLI